MNVMWKTYPVTQKKKSSETKDKRLEVGWEVGSLPLLINFPRIPLALSLSWRLKSDWQCIKKHRKKSIVQWSWKEVNGWKFQPHVRFVLEITSKMTWCSVTNVALSSAVIYLLDPIKYIQNLYMHRQFQNACKWHIVKMHLPACPLLPNPHYLRPLHVLPG